MDIDIADIKWIQMGHSVKIPHKGCSNSAAMSVTNGVDGYLVFCHKCGETAFLSHHNSVAERIKNQEIFDAERRLIQNVSYVLPEDFSHIIASKGLAWLGKGGWSCELIDAYGIGWSEELQRVILPLSVGFTARSVTLGHSPKYIEKCPADSMWESAPDRCNQIGYTEWCCITEDILSAGRVGEYIKSYSLCGTSVSTAQLGVVHRRKNIIVWLDDDRAGINGVSKAIPRLQLFSNVRVIRNKLEPKHMSNRELLITLNQCIEKGY